MGLISKIFIIESLKSTDGIKSGFELSNKLTGKIDVGFTRVDNKAQLYAEIETIASKIAGVDGLFVLHFDCHGNEDGIGLFDKADNMSFIAWESFREKFRDIYTSTRIRPVISFSSCYGFNVMKLIAAFEPCPYNIITGSLVEIAFGDSIAGYNLFYNNLNDGKALPENVEMVRRKYPDLNFIGIPARYLFEMAWDSYKQTQLTPERIKERKDQIIAEVIALQGAITKEQETMLDERLTNASGEADYARFKEKFFS